MRNDKRVGIRIKEIREAHGLSQAEFSKKIGANVKTLKNWETGISDPGVEYLRAIIEEFHVSEEFIHNTVLAPAIIYNTRLSFL